MNWKIIFIFVAMVAFVSCEGDVEPVETGDKTGDEGENGDKNGGDDEDDADNGQKDEGEENGDDDAGDGVQEGDDDDEDGGAVDDVGEVANKACFVGSYPEGPYGVAVSNTIKNLVFDDCNGGTYELSRVAGQKIIWLVVGTGWCPSCAEESRMLDAVYAANKEEIEILYVLAEGTVQGSGKISAEFCKSYAEYKKHEFPVLRDEGFKETGKYFSLAGGTPLNLLIDRCMKIRVKEEGWGDGSEKDFEMYIEMLLEEERGR